ncbi:MAG: hypothetical protein AB7K24_09000 [Gemmataceae bacterium]
MTERAICLAFLCLVVAGCGKSEEEPKGEVKGTVTFAGEPVTEGYVSFFNQQRGIEFEVPIEEEGTFVVRSREGKTIPANLEYVVTVRPLRVVGNPPGDKSAPFEMDKEAPNIPEKYRQSSSSPLKVTIKEGDNEVKVEMLP